MTEGHDGGIVSRHLFDQEVFPLLDNPPVSHALDSPLYTRGPLFRGANSAKLFTR